MSKNLAIQLIESHLLEGNLTQGSEIALKVDQTLSTDPGGTFVMMQLEALGFKRVKTELSAIYVDHNLVQDNNFNPDDHLFIQSAAQRFGFWFSRPGNGISHPVHMQYFGKPGKLLLGSDSHTCSSGALGMLAIGVGGANIVMAVCGVPFYIKMPKIFGIKLTGKLPAWVNPKDVILELLRRYGVKGGTGYILEYYGDALEHLTVMDRLSIANMGAELGATSSIFPSDEQTRIFLRSVGREADWQPFAAQAGATYDKYDEINLSELEPLIALPSSPGNVVPIKQVAGQEIYQAYIGSSASPGYKDFAISALMVKGRHIHPRVSYDINPASRSVLEALMKDGHIGSMIHAGARLHQAGCNGCIGMGQAPASGRNSLRTVPRNFKGRSGTPEDSVFICSPEVATASALTGVITDPRTLDFPCPQVKWPETYPSNPEMLQAPLPYEEAKKIKLAKGPHITEVPIFEPLPDSFKKLPVVLKVPNDISTDTIIAGGVTVMSLRGNIPKSSEYTFYGLDPTYAARAKAHPEGHMIVGGENYGQGSSREHAALCPRFLGLRIVLAKSIARIHHQNLINFGALPLTFKNLADYDLIEQDDFFDVEGIHAALKAGQAVRLKLPAKNKTIIAEYNLTKRQIEILFRGGLLNWLKTHIHADLSN